MKPPSLYQTVLGERYAQLPAAVQRFYRLQGRVPLHGEVETEAPASWLARGLAALLGTPRRAERGAIRFELDADPRTERWTRHFPARTMRSDLRRKGALLEERLGPVRLGFALDTADACLRMRLVRLRAFGLRCPRWLMPSIVAEERGEGDRLQFLVRAAWPVVGTIAGYRGHLDLPEPERQ